MKILFEIFLLLIYPNTRCIAKIKGMYNRNRTEIIYEAPRNDLIETLPDGGLPSAASGASSSSSNLARVNVISIFGGHKRNGGGKTINNKKVFLYILVIIY